MLPYIMDLEALSSCPQTNKQERDRDRERQRAIKSTEASSNKDQNYVLLNGSNTLTK